MVKRKLEQLEKKNDFFFQLKYFVFFFKFLKIVCLDWIQKLHSSNKKILQNLNKATKNSF